MIINYLRVKKSFVIANLKFFGISFIIVPRLLNNAFIFFTSKSFSQVDTLDYFLVNLVAAWVRQFFLCVIYDVHKKMHEANRKINAIIHYNRI